MMKNSKLSIALLFLSLLFTVSLFAQVPDAEKTTEPSWYESLGDIPEGAQEANNDLYIIDTGDEHMTVQVIGHDDYTEAVLNEYVSGKDFQFDKTNRVAFMQLVGITNSEGTQHFLQVIEDNGFGFVNVYNRKAKRNAQLKRYVKRVAKWKVKNPGQRFAHWFNSQWVPSKYKFSALVGDEKPIVKAVKDAPLYLAQLHIDGVANGYAKHKVTSL